jgi:type 1 glutamine amidotransferase
MVIAYGRGRVFHTALGHNNGKDITSQKCVGFITTFQRGTEWAATGKVTQKVPTDFPTATSVRVREHP